ncbi:MAG: OB-fold nucleic acid binding domain-containing protein, partial [Betaproteobacteria bacterium]
MTDQTSLNTGNAAVPQIDENHVILERRQKLAAIREKSEKAGVQAFPNDFRPEHNAAELIAGYGEKTKEELDATPSIVKVAGRMMLKRVMGKAAFATIQDATERIQLYISLQDVGEAAMENFKHYDLGDILGAEGRISKTNKGELSVFVTSLRLITKSLRPLPEKFHGLTDTEQRYRMRYVDLMVNPEVKRTFEAR